MRVVGGRLRGRALNSPASKAIRPTTDRLRESLFDILTHRYEGAVEGARVVDLFAGSGALSARAIEPKFIHPEQVNLPVRKGQMGRRAGRTARLGRRSTRICPFLTGRITCSG